MANLFYLETINALGKRQSEVWATRPPVSDGRVKSASHMGPRVVHGPVEIPGYMTHLTVAQLANVYGSNPKFGRC